MKRVIAIFVFLGPILGLLPFIYKLGPFVFIGLPFAYLFGLIPAALAAGLFIGLTSLQKRVLHEPELTKVWATILGVLAGAGGALLSLLAARVAYQTPSDNFAFLLIPAIFAGAICGVVASNFINESSIYFGKVSSVLRAQRESTCLECACTNYVSADRCTCCGAALSQTPAVARNHTEVEVEAPTFLR